MEPQQYRNPGKPAAWAATMSLQSRLPTLLGVSIPCKHLQTRRAALGAGAVGGLSLMGLLEGCDSVPSTPEIGVAQPLTGNLAAWARTCSTA